MRIQTLQTGIYSRDKKREEIDKIDQIQKAMARLATILVYLVGEPPRREAISSGLFRGAKLPRRLNQARA
jgi:hypothetical protein